MKKSISYAMNGLVRTGLGLTSAAVGLVGAKTIWEQLKLSLLIGDHPDITGYELLEQAGTPLKQLSNKVCSTDWKTITETTITQAQDLCLKNEFNEFADLNLTVILAPTIAIAFILLPTIPKGLAFLNLAYNELFQKDKRVLRATDFETKPEPKTPIL